MLWSKSQKSSAGRPNNCYTNQFCQFLLTLSHEHSASASFSSAGNGLGCCLAEMINRSPKAVPFREFYWAEAADSVWPGAAIFDISTTLHQYYVSCNDQIRKPTIHVQRYFTNQYNESYYVKLGTGVCLLVKRYF